MMTLFKVITVFFFLAISVNGFAVTTSAETLVRQTSDEMIKTLKAQKDDLKDNPSHIYGLVEKIILPHFDFERMSRLVLGKHWRKASDQQKTKFIEEFRFLLVRTYATAMLEYSDQEIEFLPFRDDSTATDVTVKTEVDQQGGFPVPIDYSLYLKDGNWLVYDVTIDDVSLVLNYRTSFSGEIRQAAGLDGLIKKLQSRNEQAVNE
jgi:phospholipid transport system substrate-binding protein